MADYFLYVHISTYVRVKGRSLVCNKLYLIIYINEKLREVGFFYVDVAFPKQCIFHEGIGDISRQELSNCTHESIPSSSSPFFSCVHLPCKPYEATSTTAQA